MASLLLILALTVTHLSLGQRVNRLEVVDHPAGMRAIALHNSSKAPQASGFVIISADGQNGVLEVDALPQLAPEQQYHVWLIRDGQSTSSATFSVDQSGYRGVRLITPDSLLMYSAIRVTIERVAGSSSSQGEQVLDGRLPQP